MTVKFSSSLSSHPSPVFGLQPPVERLLKHVIPDTGMANHWFWNDNRRNHRHNSRGHALFTWKMAPTRRSRYETRGEYCVVRVFLEHQLGPIPPRTQVENLCRLPQCVNPAHWRVHYTYPTQRIALLKDGQWQLVDHSTGIPCPDVAVPHIFDGQAVHLVRVLPRPQRGPDPLLYGLCGHPINAHTARVVTTPVTCTVGC